MWSIEKNVPRHTRRTRAVFSLLSLSSSLLFEPSPTISFQLGRGWVEWANAGVNAEGFRPSSSKRSSHVSFLSISFHFLFPFVSLTHSATMKILPVLLLRPSSGWEEARDDSARTHFLLLLSSSFFIILLRNFPRHKPRQQIFTDGPQGGRSNKCLIVLTILSVLHEFHRVLPLVKQRSFALYLSAFNFPPRSASLLLLLASYYFLVFFFFFFLSSLEFDNNTPYNVS